MESIYLVGAEEVGNAGRAMRSAADSMRLSAMSIEASFARHEHFLEQWLVDFRDAMEKAKGIPIVDGKART